LLPGAIERPPLWLSRMTPPAMASTVKGWDSHRGYTRGRILTSARSASHTEPRHAAVAWSLLDQSEMIGFAGTASAKEAATLLRLLAVLTRLVRAKYDLGKSRWPCFCLCSGTMSRVLGVDQTFTTNPSGCGPWALNPVASARRPCCV
jgi:hypothetical protein